MSIGSIIRAMRSDNIIQTYSQKNRLIPHHIYQQLKKKVKCDHCHKGFANIHAKEIHHEKPVKYGGTNDITNLRVVHKNCHDECDIISNEKYGGKK